MKLVFDLSKSLDKTKLVQVQRTVQGKHGQYQRMQWVKPSDVKDTDKVIGGQDSMEISEKNFPVGSKIYYKGEEATVQRVGKEFSGGGMGIVVRFSKGGTGTIGKSDMKNVSKTPPKKSTSNDSTDSKEELKVGQKVKYDGMRYKIDSINGNKVTMTARSTDNYSVDDPRYKNGDLTRTVDKSELLPKDSEPKKSDTITVKGKTFKAKNGVITVSMYDLQERLSKVEKFAKDNGYKVEYAESKKNNSDSVPNKALGKTWSDTKTELDKMGYKVDSIFSSQPPQPKEKLILYKDGKEYEAEVTKYHNGDYEILGSSIKEVKKDDDTKDSKKTSDNSTNKPTKVRKVSNMNDLQNGIKSINRAIGKEHNIFNAVSVMGGGKLGEQLAYVSIPKLQTESNAKKVIDEQLKREFGDSVKYSLTKESDHFVVKLKLDDNKTSNTSTGKAVDQPNSDKPITGSKFDASEFTKLKSDRTKAIQYLKDSGISWKETDNEGINWMRACMAASRAENPAQGATKKDSASKSSSDTKASGKSTEEAKKAVKDLLSANNNDRAKVMQIAKASGVTWKESDNDGINWMRASLAIQKHQESGKTISTSASDDKKDDTKTDDKPSAKKVSISDLKRPASNNTSTNLVAGDYNISVTKLRNVGANAKQHPSFYRIVVEKDGDRVFYTDKTDWSDIKEHAKRYIDSASSSDSKSDKKSDSNPTHDNPLVTTETKSGKPYQIWESNGRIYGSLPGKQDSRNVRDIRDFTSSGFETLDEVKDYIKKYF